MPHLRNGKPGDKHIGKSASKGLTGQPFRAIAVKDDHAACIPPVRFGFRSFDRQWIIPDGRLINQANPELWRAHSVRQIHFTSPEDKAPSSGPAITATDLIPDAHHYAGRGGRVIPLYLDYAATVLNVRPGVLEALSWHFGCPQSGEDIFAYIAAIAMNPAFTSRFRADLKQPGLRIPITGDPALFGEAVDLGKRVLWLHCFGERFADPAKGRPAKAPRKSDGPAVPAGGTFQKADDPMPDVMDYDAGAQRLRVGAGYVENVPKAVWEYEVSGVPVLRQWFSYRREKRERPVIGDRRPPSPLGDIQPDRWLHAYTQDLLDVLHVLCLLVELEPAQAELLARICDGPLVTYSQLAAVDAFAMDASVPRKPSAIDDPRDGTATGETPMLPGVSPKH